MKYVTVSFQFPLIVIECALNMIRHRIGQIRILSWLTRHSPPPYMVRYIGYFEDVRNIFLV